jgi:phosphoesterase RecJ-like protein
MHYKQIAPQILEIINTSDNILLVSHEKPDGDTLGSALAMANFLDKAQKPHKHFCIDSHADYFNYLFKIENIINDYNLIKLDDHDLVITIDCGDLNRTGIANDLIKLKNKFTIINIDHHASNDYFGHHNLVIPQASSTSEIIYNFFYFHDIKIDKYMATSLLTGILTDTMNFTNAATTQESLKIAADLINRGAKINQIISKITQNKNLAALKLWGQLFTRLEFNPRYNFVYTVITQEDIKKNQVANEDVREGLANFLSMIKDVDFILVLTQETENKIKGSLRTTKDNVNVDKLAQALGGGGHAKAAGFVINGQLIKTANGWQIK